MFPVVDTGVPPATRQCPCWSSASRGEQGPARRPHQRRQRVSLGTACRPVSNPWVRPAHREREILRPPPSPPRRRPAAAGRPPRRRATDPECGTQWPRSEKPFFSPPARGQAASTAHHARSQTENHFLESRSTSASVASAAAAVLFRNSKIGIGFHRLKGDQARSKCDPIPWLSTGAHPCRRVSAAVEKPLFRESWKECGSRLVGRLDPAVPLTGSDRNGVASSCKKINSETSLKKIWARHP